jgi:uncharacterized protein (TIGR04255 family)
MTDKLPNKLNKCPIVDSVFEIRFESNIEQGAVFGMVYGKLRDEYPKTEELPIRKFPQEIISNDLNSIYKPHYKISNDNTLIQIGPKVLAISSFPVYQGWETYSRTIVSIIKKIDELGIIDSINRIGLRYINVFDENVFSEVLKLKINMGDKDYSNEKLVLRNEIIDGLYKKVISLSTATVLGGNKDKRIGSLIDIDVSKDNEINNLLSNPEEELTAIHLKEKTEFFNLIRKDYLIKMEPEY